MGPGFSDRHPSLDILHVTLKPSRNPPNQPVRSLDAGWPEFPVCRVAPSGNRDFSYFRAGVTYPMRSNESQAVFEKNTRRLVSPLMMYPHAVFSAW